MREYNISFIDSYIKEKGISIDALSKKSDIDINELILCLKDDKLANQKMLNKLLKFFNIPNYKSLRYVMESYTSLCNLYKEKDNIDVKRYDISFLKDYLDINNIKQKSVVKKTNICYSAFNKYLNGLALISSKDLKNILKIFGVSSYEELKENSYNNKKIILHDIENTPKRYDISFLKDYIALKGIRQSDLVRKSGISKQLISLYIKGDAKIPFDSIEKILDIFNVKTYEELQELVKIDSTNSLKNINLDKEEEYDISFLSSYIKLKGILITKLSKKALIPNNYLRKCLDGRTKLKESYLPKLLKAFGVSSYEELKELVKNDNTILKNNIDESIIEYYDISFIYSYILVNKISQTELSKKFCVTQGALSNRLKGKHYAKIKLVKKFNDYFNVESYDGLYKFMDKEQNKINLLMLRRNIEIIINLKNDLLKDYINSKPIINKYVDFDELIEFLDEYNISDKSFNVIVLLFNKNYNLSFKEISTLMNISITDVLKIYRDCIQICTQMHYNKLNSDMLILKRR